MTAATRAKQIAELSDQIVPLGKKARGMRLTADDWNEIVSVLSAMLGIDRAQDDDTEARLDAAYARADHQHLGQVTLEWLDPDLQARLASGEGPIAMRQMLAAMQKTVDGLNEQVSQLKALVEKQQAALDTSASDALDRKRQLALLETRFGSIEDLRVTVGGIAKSQAALDKNVTTVLDLRGKLTDAAGKPIDLSALVTRVDDLQGLRDSLTGVDGKPLRLKDLQVQVLNLSDKLPLAGNGGIAGPIFDPAILTASNKSLEEKLTADSQTRIDTLRGELLAANDKVSTTLNGKIDQGLASAQTATLASAADLIKASEARIGTSVTSQVATARQTLAASLQDQANTAVAAGLANVDTRIGSAVDLRVGALGTKLASDLDTSISAKTDQKIAASTAAFGTRLSAVETNVATVSAAIPTQVDKRVADATAALQVRFDSQIDQKTTALQASLTPIIDQRVNAGVDAGLVKIRDTASQTVANSLADLDTRIATSVTSATRTLPDQVSSQVKTQLAAANIPAQIATANAATTAQLRTEIAASAAKVTEVNTAALNNVRTEMTSMAATRVAAPPAGGISIPVDTPVDVSVRNPRLTPR